MLQMVIGIMYSELKFDALKDKKTCDYNLLGTTIVISAIFVSQ